MGQMARYIKGSVVSYIDYTPGSDVAAGDVIVDGDMLLICTGGTKKDASGTGISSGQLGAVVCRGGLFEVVADGVIGKRKRVYWDATAKKVTLTRGANLLFGFLGDVAASADGDVVSAEFSPGRGDIATSTVAATGSAQGDAALLADGFNLVTAADGTKGVILPLASAGREVRVKNSSASALKVYPATSDGINALSVNAAFSMPANTCSTFTAYDATTWYSNPLLPS